MCNQNEKGFVDPLVTEGEHDHEFVCTLTDSVCVFCGVSQNTGTRPISSFNDTLKF